MLQPLAFCWLLSDHSADSMVVVSRSSPEGLWLGASDESGDIERISHHDLYLHYPEARTAVTNRQPLNTALPNGNFRVVLPFFSSPKCLASIVVAECRELPSQEQQEGIVSFLQFHANYLSLLDYGELDTLTGLLNRKTFDETLERLLARQPGTGLHREKRSASHPHWLAVLDIDKFKHINDTWGHLFGDETLLLFSRILKQSFRCDDRLFRFGGEEFVVIIQAPDHNCAFSRFDHFRIQLEAVDFAQVGRITCSVGFTMMNPARPATNILGCADQALYFAKVNGRNQTRSYEALLDEGLIEAHDPAEGSLQLDFDIDSLFA